MLKRLLAYFLTLCVFFAIASPAMGYQRKTNDFEEIESECFCRTDPEWVQELTLPLEQAALKRLQKAAQNGSREEAYISNFKNGAMPSLGSVKMLVLVIDFDDSRMSEEHYGQLQSFYNDEYDETLSTKGFWAQSVRGGFQQLSYGSFNLSADILPIYHAERDPYYYASHANGERLLVEKALQYYADLGAFDPQDYDANKDGVIDGLSIRPYFNSQELCTKVVKEFPNNFLFSTYSSARDYSALGKANFLVNPIRGYYTDPIFQNPVTPVAFEMHEVGHFLGLPDHYNQSIYAWLDSTLGDLMTGSTMYLSVYYKLLLG